MSDKTEPSVEVVDIHLNDRGQSWGSLSSGHTRAASCDWADEARPRFERSERVAARDPEYDPITVRVEFDADNPTVADFITMLADGSMARLRLAAPDDQSPDATILAIELRPADQPTRRWLRGVGLGAMIDSVNDVITKSMALDRLVGASWRRPVQRPGRAGRPDLHYAELAASYVEALRESPRSPIKHLVAAAAARGEYVTEPQLRARLGRARKRGLLSDAGVGAAGGELTDKAIQLLGEKES